jgi:hypothetical protein
MLYTLARSDRGSSRVAQNAKTPERQQRRRLNLKRR